MADNNKITAEQIKEFWDRIGMHYSATEWESRTSEKEIKEIFKYLKGEKLLSENIRKDCEYEWQEISGRWNKEMSAQGSENEVGDNSFDEDKLPWKRLSTESGVEYYIFVDRLTENWSELGKKIILLKETRQAINFVNSKNKNVKEIVKIAREKIAKEQAQSESESPTNDKPTQEDAPNKEEHPKITDAEEVKEGKPVEQVVVEPVAVVKQVEVIEPVAVEPVAVVVPLAQVTTAQEGVAPKEPTEEGQSDPTEKGGGGTTNSRSALFNSIIVSKVRETPAGGYIDPNGKLGDKTGGDKSIPTATPPSSNIEGERKTQEGMEEIGPEGGM